MTAAARSLRRRRRARIRTGVTIAAIVVASLTAGVLAWAASPLMAEQGALAEAGTRVTITEHADGVVLTPRARATRASSSSRAPVSTLPRTPTSSAGSRHPGSPS
ncbi:hypothetical protein GCM10025869_03510 [Homoserinibacter gongjuensis]|uniref:SAF domain-containing protein n=1 Tax=Homoserinibacter gongjuensis TaxID=1162968 RepID=A0ABQ6JSM3_9MICO|nr:hypothetical protein GCM10025869_03510 [Homoserinibacter gongjuensis]